MYILYGIILLLLFLLIYMVFIEPRRLLVKNFFIRKNKTKVLDISKAYDLYEDQTAITIAHLSDFHFSRFYKPRRINRVIASTMTNRPDIIVFTGDLIDNYTKWPHQQTKKLVEKLKKLSAPMGKIAVLGNHDYNDHGQYFVMEVLKEAGFTVLKNEEIFGSNEKISINIAGMDDVLRGEPQFNYERTLAQWHILLVHEPDSVLRIRHVKDYDLILAGHSHGGQIRLPFLSLKHTGATHFTHGFYLLGKRALLSVSNGLGTTKIPARLRVPPEITYYHLEKEKRTSEK
ncbi:MAG TPA: metallophosphoesterase [Candidatus Tetragenococcus pullicola]|nr:metallophosphoesterase [Candidatus Tetragenococcus pullicola]